MMNEIKEFLLKNKKRIIIIAIISISITSAAIYYQTNKNGSLSILGIGIIFISSVIACFFFEKQMVSNYNDIKGIIKAMKERKKNKKEKKTNTSKYEIKTKGSKGDKNEKNRNRIKRNDSSNRGTKEDEE